MNIQGVPRNFAIDFGVDVSKDKFDACGFREREKLGHGYHGSTYAHADLDHFRIAHAATDRDSVDKKMVSIGNKGQKVIFDYTTVCKRPICANLS